MATRSLICRVNADKSVTAIYCHWDGYPSHHLPILRQHYSDPESLDELLLRGSLSVLGERITPTGPHTWDDPEQGVCVFHARDRKESLQILSYSSMQAIPHWVLSTEYWYFWDNGVWRVTDGTGVSVPEDV